MFKEWYKLNREHFYAFPLPSNSYVPVDCWLVWGENAICVGTAGIGKCIAIL